MVIGFLEKRLEDFFELVHHFASSGEAERLDVLCHTLVALEKRKIISHTAHGHITFNDFLALVKEALRLEIEFRLTQGKR